jgi:hypothetical protein
MQLMLDAINVAARLTTKGKQARAVCLDDML